MGLVELAILIFILAIVGLILHLLVRALRARKSRIKIALDKNIPEYDLDELELRELPNGGARMVQRSFEEVMRQASELESLDAARKRPRSKVLKTDLSREAVLARRAAALAAAGEAAARGDVPTEADLFAAQSADNDSQQNEFGGADDFVNEAETRIFHEPVVTTAADPGQDPGQQAGDLIEYDPGSAHEPAATPEWATDAVRADEYDEYAEPVAAPVSQARSDSQEAVSLTDYSDDDWLDDVSPVREVAVSRPVTPAAPVAASRAADSGQRT